MKARHEWWAAEIAAKDPAAYEAMARYITDLEAEPTVDDWLDSIDIQPMLTMSELEDLLVAPDPLAAIIEWKNEHDPPELIVDIETGDKL